MWKTPLTFQGIRQLFQHGARNSNVDSVAKFYKNILISMKYLLSQQCVLSSQSECILFKLDMKGRFKPRTMLLQCVHSFQIKYIRQILSCIGYTCEWTSFWLYWKVNHFSGIQTWKESVEILLANCEEKKRWKFMKQILVQWHQYCPPVFVLPMRGGSDVSYLSLFLLIFRNVL